MASLDLHPFVRSTVVDKARGTMLGAALGDALGLYTEFLPGHEASQAYAGLPSIVIGSTPFRADSHRDRFDVGSWTDDTDHALLLVLAYIHLHQTSAPVTTSSLALEFAGRLHVWCSQGLLALSRPPLGIGHTIGSLALKPTYPEDPKAAALISWCKASSSHKPASNGSCMRTHPVGVIAVTLPNERAAYDLATEICHTTHVDPRAVLSCITIVVVLRGIICGDILDETDLDATIDRAVAWFSTNEKLVDPWSEAPSIDGVEKPETGNDDYVHLSEFLAVTGRSSNLDSLNVDDKSMGYTYTCLGAGILMLRAAMRSSRKARVADPSISSPSDMYVSLMMDLIKRGGDADTNGAVAGALLGAWFGGNGLPQAWLSGLQNHAWLESKVAEFIGCLGLFGTPGNVEVSNNHSSTPMAESHGLQRSWWEDEDPDARPDGGKGYLTKEQIDRMEKDMVLRVLAKKRLRDQAEDEKKKAGKGSARRWLGL